MAACTLLLAPLSAAHAQSGTTTLTLHLEAAVIVEPPRLLHGADVGSAGPLADADIGCDGLEGRGGLATGPWRVLVLRSDGAVHARLATGGDGTASDIPAVTSQVHCGAVRDRARGELRAGGTLLQVDPTRLPGGSITFVVEEL